MESRISVVRVSMLSLCFFMSLYFLAATIVITCCCWLALLTKAYFRHALSRRVLPANAEDSTYFALLSLSVWTLLGIIKVIEVALLSFGKD